MICRFIAEHKARSGVASICRALSAQGSEIAPRTYDAWAVRAPSKRALWDTAVTEVLTGYYDPDQHGRRQPEASYGSLKMWAHLNRTGIRVARCTVERLMKANGRRGVTRTKKVRTTIADPAATPGPGPGQPPLHHAGAEPAAGRGPHLRAPGHRHVCYTVFVIDSFAARIVGWECSASKHTAFIERPSPSLGAPSSEPLETRLGRCARSAWR